MHLLMSFGWTTVLESDRQVTSFLPQLRDLVIALGGTGLYAEVMLRSSGSRQEDLDGHRDLAFDRNRLVHSAPDNGVRIEVYPTTPFPTEYQSWPGCFIATYPPGLRRRPTAYPTTFEWLIELHSYEQIVKKLARFLHLLGPAWLTIHPYVLPSSATARGPMSMCSYDAAHVAQARSLGIQLAPALPSQVGSWFRVHGEGIDSVSPAARSADATFQKLMRRLRVVRHTEAFWHWKPKATGS